MSDNPLATSVMFLIAILLCLMMIVFISTKAKASECTSIRDEDKRRECLAVERQDPNDCTSIRNSDDRTLCRQRAGQRPLYRERY